VPEVTILDDRVGSKKNKSGSEIFIGLIWGLGLGLEI